MRLMMVLAGLLIVLISAEAGAQAGYCDCYGGFDAQGAYWPLLDFEGRPLQDGDWVYAAWTGPDGEIDPPDARGYPTDDDVLLPISNEAVEYNGFFLTVASWAPGTVDYEGNPRHPTEGDLIYCRIFDGPADSLNSGYYYADSQTHEVIWKLGDVLYCLFPGDPGFGRTDTPLPLEPAAADTAAPGTTVPDTTKQESPEAESCPD